MYFPKVIERDVRISEFSPDFAYPTNGALRDYKALVNPENNQTYSIVSRGYKLTRHEEVWEPIVNALVQAEHEFGKIHIDTQFPDDGAKMWTIVRFPNIQYEIKKGDLINPTLEFFNSYDLSWSIRSLFNAFRLLCLNGMKTIEKLFQFRKTHSQFYHSSDVVDMVRSSFRGYEKQALEWHKWTEIPVLPKIYENVMENLNLSGRRLDEIGNTVEVSSGLKLDDIKTLSLPMWDFYNILCQYFTHQVDNPVRRHDLYQKLGRSLQ